MQPTNGRSRRGCNQKEAERKVEIAAKRSRIVSSYDKLWRCFIDSWAEHRRHDSAWLTCAGNYMLDTHGLKWAVDPYMLSSRLPEIPAHDVSEVYGDLAYVLLTHTHGDHCDPELWHQLEELPCRWIVPDHVVELFVDGAGMGNVDYIVASPGEEIEVAGMRVIPFASPHYGRHLDGRRITIEETGYLVRVGSRSYLFPGDVRTYDPVRIDACDGVDVVFAHVFLGREAALSADPPLLKEFVDFYLSYSPKRIVLGHLYDFQASIRNCWVDTHAEMVTEALHWVDVGVDVVTPEWYGEVIL